MLSRKFIPLLVLATLVSCEQSSNSKSTNDSNNTNQTVSNEERVQAANAPAVEFDFKFQRATNVSNMGDDFEKFRKNANRFQVIVQTKNDQTIENARVLCVALKDREISNDIFKSTFRDGKQAVVPLDLSRASNYAVKFS